MVKRFHLSKLSIVVLLAVVMTACSSGPGTPAFSTVTPTVQPPTFVPTLPPPTLPPTAAPTVPGTVSQTVPVKVGEGPCVNVQDPTGVTVPADGKTKQFGAPQQVIDPTHVYCAIVTTPKGRIVIQLYPTIAPKHVNSFVFLAQQGFYDGITWHRVVADFVIQAGDPTGTGSGGPGYNLDLETNAAVKYDRVGVLGMARTAAPNTAGSQWFITTADNQSTRSLDPGGVDQYGYTIFGQVVAGYDVALKIAQGDALTSVRVVDLGAAAK